MFALAELPETLFLEILEYLSPSQVVLCRLISRDVYLALGRPDVCRRLLLSLLPHTHEARLLRFLNGDGDDAMIHSKDWPAIFVAAARRHHHLTQAKPYFVQELPILKDPAAFEEVTPWNRHLRLNEHNAPLHHQDPVWTYGKEEALLVFPTLGHEYRALDLATGHEYTVPFHIKDKLIRRVRLNEGLLVFEWAEQEAFHQLNEGEMVHRHFATAFDVRSNKKTYDILPDLPVSALDGTQGENEVSPDDWRFTLRAEWKIHYLGLPLSVIDRFFSAHNATHYALYVWQPNRSPWGEDSPLERLIIWDLGSPDDSSEDSIYGSAAEPTIIRRVANAELAPWGIRQSNTPSLRSMALDQQTRDPLTGYTTGHLFLTTEDHRWVAGLQSSLIPPRLHCVRTIGIPLEGDGPCWEHGCGTNGGDATNCRRGIFAGEGSMWPGWAPCWRHEDFPYLTVAQVVDVAAGVRFCARQCFMLETVSVDIHLGQDPKRVVGSRPRIRGSRRRSSSVSSSEREEEVVPEDGTAPDAGGLVGEAQFSDEVWGQLMAKGAIAGDGRWLIGEDAGGDIKILYF
ncbi:hypothetical protein ACHAQA_002769 [Verticillium albo-atrum]